MTPNKHIQFSILLISISIAAEVAFITKLFPITDQLYAYLHLFLMALLIGSQFSLSRNNKPGTFNYALWFGTGTLVTAIGDYVNSGASTVTPVSNKLTFALFLFGVGYIIYNVVLWKINQELFKKKQSEFSKKKYLFVIPIIAINLIGWIQHVAPNVKPFDMLYYGSFIFNLTIYVAMPLFGLWYYHNTGWKVNGLVIFIGTLLIPYSDLILFYCWMKDVTNPTQPGLLLYAANWILYFGGQILICMLPAFIAIEAEER